MRELLISLLLGFSVLVQAGAYSLPHTLPDRERSRAELASDALQRGEALRRQWDLAGAEAAFHEAADLEPASLGAVLGLARVARARLDYAKAIALLDKAAIDNQNSPDLLAEYGSVYLAAEEPERARREFEKVLQISASHPPAIIGLACADLLQREYDRAIRSLRESLRREPNNVSANALLARVLLENNKDSEAAAEAGRAIALDPFNVEALYVLAYVKSIQGKADESRSLARRVVSLDPFNFGARRVLSQYLDGRAGYEQRVPERARLRYLNGWGLKQEGHLERAVTELEAALRIENRYYRALIALADIWLKQGDYERAADTAKLAIAVDPDGAIAHLELSCAHRGMSERSRIEIGAVDFGALFYSRPVPAAYALTREIFPNYDSLTRRQQEVIDVAVGPLAMFLPQLARSKARHYLLAFDQRPSDLLQGLSDVAGEKTFDGRYYASLRGVGGRVSVSGIEYLDQAARGGFNTVAHEFAHQVHIAALGKDDVKQIRNLYERALREGRTLDYYAAANEQEYFAQGYEAFVSDRKRPSAGVTARHTRSELFESDPELHRFLVRLTGKTHEMSDLGKSIGRGQY